jgi:hypothetical protein
VERQVTKEEGRMVKTKPKKKIATPARFELALYERV